MTDSKDMLEDTMKGKYLIFSLDEENYGLDICYVTEIVGIQPITVVPELPEFVKGIINLRGDIIPVMDARVKFGKSELEYNDRTCIVVIDVNQLLIGIIVDAVRDVLSIDDDQIVPPPMVGGDGRKYIKNIAKHENKVILVIDCEALLNEDELSEISQVNE
ncbi:purine-binding chemotaxis protein CheW [Acidaminobacter sp. JC074]|uniref:chemotaxis protein CheW n=1 Tax=Acidaminobacter sp. JC074 TaxID=2530199 RepID=UPI001F0F358E|nr:chemotaxis protein CheW [Acidaminobacter sp. JC074]MCH4890793.1 purine-binding chemotaxis protein CheW [Acidaminobacter sp. JC074]